MLVIATFPQFVMATVKPMTPPGNPLVAGQSLATVRQGVVRTGQVLVALPVTRLLQTSRAVTPTMSVMEQTLVGTGSVPLTTAPWPGSSLVMVPTGVPAVG